ncbi:MAG: phosphate propanoyltransferase [Oscillospiraceae bacterium]|nr:phosphate propanoyltransferase [Oscillospiraceae bacterium]
MADNRIIIEGSGRHIHLSQTDLEALFGTGFELVAKKYLSQPGEFASESRVDVVGPKGTIQGVGILGPTRAQTQVELSYTDARILGINAPIRESGNLAGSAPCALVGPAGKVDLAEGAIIAKRHIHFTPEDAEKFGVVDKEIVQVITDGDRALIFDEVVVRVSPKYATYMHVDYDEINAAALFGEVTGIVKKK